MIAALTKRVEEVGTIDLRELIGWPESENVEYKSDLSEPEPWYTRSGLTDSSKKKIFKELVAFANTSGGRLFIGISETTGGGPPRASAIHPIPRCVDLATRLEQALIVSIDPPFTFLRAIGVPTDGDAGVVILDVPASYSGPHRSSDFHCYARKGTHSIRLGMREIHDIVIRLSRRQDEIKNRLNERRELFKAWKGGGSRVAFRVTGVPVSAPLYIDQVFDNNAVSRDLIDIRGHWAISRLPELQKEDFSIPCKDLSEGPVLGGTAWTRVMSDGCAARQVIMRNGLIDLWFRVPWISGPSGQARPIFQLGWVIALCANTVVRAHAFREVAEAPASEYALQVEFLSTMGPANSVIQITSSMFGFQEDFGSAFDTPVILDLYQLDERDEVINRVLRDLYDASGIRLDRPTLKIDWPS